MDSGGEERNISLRVDADGAGQRLDLYLSRALPELSRTRIQHLIADGRVLVGVGKGKAGARLREGAAITVSVPPLVPCRMEPEDIALDIVYEDDDLLVLNKPAGICVHPGAGNPAGTVANALLAHCKGRLSGIGGVERPGIVHRLDKDTSGLLAVAKNDAAHKALSEQFAGRRVRKMYVAFVLGRLKRDEGVIEKNIVRHPTERKKMTVSATAGRRAYTQWKLLSQKDGYALLSFVIGTGRTHQIRVHASSMGHPVIGDRVYGGKKACALGALKPARQLLHAMCLGFAHPGDGRELDFFAPVPEDFMDWLGPDDIEKLNAIGAKRT